MSLGLDAVTEITYPVGKRFSFGLGTVEAPVAGRIEDVSVEMRGTGLTVLGYQLTQEGNPTFDVTDEFPPVVRWLEGLGPAVGSTISAQAAGVRLVVGLEVVGEAYTEIRGIDVTLVGDDGKEHDIHLAVGLVQCGPSVTDDACDPI